MKKETTKQRCEYSEEGLRTFGKQRRGYVLGESKDGRGWRLLWDGLKTTQVYAKDFININPLIELYTDDDGTEKEIPLAITGHEPEITPEIIENIEKSLEYLRKTGLNERALIVLIKDYCGYKVGITEIKEVVSAIHKLKSYFLTP